MKKLESINKVNQLETEQMSELVGGRNPVRGTLQDRATTYTTDKFDHPSTGDTVHEWADGEGGWFVQSVKWYYE